MFNRIDCWLKMIWKTMRRFIKTGEINPVSGHFYHHDNIEIYRNCVVMIDYCSNCGHKEYSFAKEGTTAAEGMLRGYEDEIQQ